MADANAHIRVISDLFPHMNKARNRSENIGIHALFSCLHVRGSFPICAMWEEKIRIGLLEPFTNHIDRGISDLSAYMADANAHIRVISDLFPHMNKARNRSENIGIHALFSCLHVRGSFPICAMWEEKIRIGLLEPFNLKVSL